MYGDLTSGNSDSEARIHTGNDGGGNPTVWYNYAAASAMTVTGTGNLEDPGYNICPRGWTMPTLTQAQGILGYASAFSPVTGGHYMSGNLEGISNYWTSTYANGADRWYITWNDSSLGVSRMGGSYIGARMFGDYLRCIAQ